MIAASATIETRTMFFCYMMAAARLYPKRPLLTMQEHHLDVSR
jgi:hypothetical protein